MDQKIHSSINLIRYKEVKMMTGNLNNKIRNPPSDALPLSGNGDFVIEMARFSGIFQDNNPILLFTLKKRIKENNFDVSTGSDQKLIKYTL